ncbi:uncharacterized protein LOC127288196 isoform X2 [Leptopilina boulardi]|uniref:uncharacterized protein LOC127288196 isoform X2 n=1 Tax=Leptopilina boulardi TaxID=63433 RepID=UPI0021F55BA9|nr:uncharacterized protein LOC127288196 isoform X2 [Leptopilina boulardi]XP_051171459.1 uncharacterized protein LOC127288196 isoform X2 [Leptopilina boulardi]
MSRENENIMDEEDEDVVLQVNLSMKQIVFSFYNSILCTIQLQDNQFLNEQLRLILRLDCLLDDHASKIQSFVDDRKQCVFKKAMHLFPLVSSSVTIYYGLFKKCKSVLSIMLASSIFTLTAHRRFLRWKASKNLKHLISLQNDFYHSCKNSLKILRYSFRMKSDPRKSGQKFVELEKSKHMYLLPLTGILISSLENVSLLFYQASNCIFKLLPTSVSNDDLKTIFETGSFSIRGEVTYQTLKNHYYMYLLVQSEMLHLLAIAYNQDTWRNFGRCPEIKLIHIITNLTMSLEKYCSKLSKVLNEFSTKKFEPQHREYKGSRISKWQDLYVHLDLTAYKLQIAYKVLLSTLEEIDSHSNENSNDDFSEIIMQNLNEVYKQIDTAKSFTEFSSLLVAKVQHEQSKSQIVQEMNIISNSEKIELPIILDSEPQIFDEVFEEYIKEEYLKPLYEDGDESVVQNYKFDKLLAKNFMSELKDALLEKHNSMSERESKALQRMYRNVTQEISSKQGDNLTDKIDMVPPPPPLPLNSSMTLDNNEEKNIYSFPNAVKPEGIVEKINLIQENELENLPDEKEILKRLTKQTFYGNEDQEDDEKIDVQRFSIIQCKPNFPLFLKVSEETFIGSGENSEEELIVSEVEDDVT